MKKKEKTTTKIISKLILFLFVISLFGFTLPTQTFSASSFSDTYNNPNQNNNSAYKFKISDVVNSNLLTSVVGCTGVVNKVSTWMIKFIQSPAKQTEIAAANLDKVRKMLESACASGKAPAESAGNSVPGIGGLAKSIDTILAKVYAKVGGKDVAICQDQVKNTNDTQLALDLKTAEKENEVILKEQCFDGIAITLAKNQLTAMTRSAMNWVNTGFGGNPFFVQNMTNLTNSIERNVIETGTDILLDKALGGGNQSPYAENFARSTITGMNLVSSSEKFLGNLTSTLDSFITDPQSYYTNDELNSAQNTRTALERAQQANDMFANDFSVGGWDGWMALTQLDQNNPLGFTMLANDYLANVQAQKISDTKDELAQNNGFLSQKTCVTWNDDVKKALQDDYDFNLEYEKDVCTESSLDFDEDECTEAGEITLQSKDRLDSFVKECTEYKTITPGSIIRDKTTNYLNSPERQLELAKTINDSLNALFSILISKLEEGGLSGLSDSATNTTNWTDSTNSFSTTDSNGNSTYDNGGAYNNFNLTRDLGNTYIYNDIKKLGTWNASANTATLENANYLLKFNAINIKLYPDTPPEVYKTATDGEVKLTNNLYGNLVNPINGYYTVTTSGKTKIITAGYNTWEKGDRAFWNGSEWQNWKCYKPTTTDKSGACDNQLNPIKKRGVIQIQNDYIVAGKEILGELDQIMPNLGELDYCLPGPNPNYKINSTDAQSAYQDWVGSMYVGVIDTSGKRFGVKIDQKEGDITYDNLMSVYSPSIWIKIKESMSDLIFQFSHICDSGQSGDECKINYFYQAGAQDKWQAEHLAAKQDLINTTLDYVNNDLFQKFYSTFDTEMNDKYFKKMTSPYLDTETSIGLDTNPNYISMAQAGFDLTKDIVYYSDETTKAKQDYTDAITTARINISKLDPIKSEVSGIIQAAQKRRDANLLVILNNEAKRTGGAVLTEAQYKTKYIGCLDEEDIQFYDADKITAMGSPNEENCADGIDNDGNGLVDGNDTACSLPMSITATPWVVKSGNKTKISWSAEKADSCSLSDGTTTEKLTPEVGTTGGSLEKTITATTNFILSCSLKGGITKKNATVNLMVPPATPTGLTAVAGLCNSGTVNINFNPSMGASNYKVYRDGTKIYDNSKLGGTSEIIKDTGLTPVSANADPRPPSHSYKVQACNEVGCSNLSAPALTQALACPWYGVYYMTNDVVGKENVMGWIGVAGMKLSAWNPKADDPHLGWPVTAIPNPGYVFDYWSVNKPKDINDYSVDFIRDGVGNPRTDADIGYVTYKAYVMANFKKVPLAPPLAPKLTITPSATCKDGKYSINLSWTASPGAVGYSVYKKIGTGTPSLKPATIYTTYDDTGLTPGGTYSYMVNAFNSDGGTSTAQLKEITLPACKFTLTYLSNNSAWGVISGNATQLITSGLSGESVYAGAIPGYKFVNWNDGQTNNPRKDSNITANHIFTATFIKQ